VQFVHGRPGDPFHNRDKYLGKQRNEYDGWEDADADRDVWMYTACESFYCNSPGNPLYKYDSWNYFRGWPGYAIDEPTTQQRTMGFLSFKYEAAGEYYYEMVNKLSTAWTRQYAYGANGDGTLFYPGLPKGRGKAGEKDFAPAIGGSTDIPIESIRLKRIRDAREDYDYVALLTSMGQEAAARDAIDDLFDVPQSDHAMWDEVLPSELEATRRDLIELIGN
jgi:hypothetical protein